MIVVGTIGLAASFAWLSQARRGDSYLSGVFGPMLLNGLSAGLVFMPVTSTVLTGVEPEHAGSASGLLQTFQQLGGAIGLAVIVSVYAAGAVPGQFLPGAEPAFLTSALFALTALAVAVLAVDPGPAQDARRVPHPRGGQGRLTGVGHAVLLLPVQEGEHRGLGLLGPEQRGGQLREVRAEGVDALDERAAETASWSPAGPAGCPCPARRRSPLPRRRGRPRGPPG